MSVQSIILFRDDEHNTEDTCKLLLYHDLSGKILSTNDKEQRIGIIKGMWRFSNEFSKDGVVCHIELEAYSMVVLEVDPSYYLTIAFDSTYDDQWQKYSTRLNQCYQFFAMQNGRMATIEDKKLSRLLNEHFIPFWDEINLIPDYFVMQDINCSLGENLFPRCQFRDALDSVNEVKEWQTFLKNNILLSQENYPNIKDICLYHAPQDNKDSKKYGFVANFDPQFKSLPVLSNWILGIDAMYGTITSHGLAGTMSLAETEQQIELDAEETEPESASNIRTVWDNVTLPITFTMDAIKDIGQLTGVSNSLSLFTDIKPTWNPLQWSRGTEAGSLNAKNDKGGDEYSWLISPLNPSFLPKVYQMRTFYLEFDSWKQYNVIFWKFKDILAAVIIDSQFTKINEEPFLMRLQEDLWSGMSLFYENPGFEERPCSFDYTIVYKEENMYYSSIPMWKNGLDEDENAFKLVIKGLDDTLQFLKNNANRKTSVATVTEVGHNMMLTEHKIPSEADNMKSSKVGDNGSWGRSIFNKVNEKQLRELNKELMVILGSRNYTASYTEADTKESLLKLNNGLMVYLLEDNRRLVFIIKNWFEDPQQTQYTKKKKEASRMIDSLGREVSRWWDQIKDHEPM